MDRQSHSNMGLSNEGTSLGRKRILSPPLLCFRCLGDCSDANVVSQRIPSKTGQATDRQQPLRSACLVKRSRLPDTYRYPVVQGPHLSVGRIVGYCEDPSGYISCPFLISRNGVSRCVAATVRLMISRTIHPLLINASAMRERWQRHGTTSAHIMAVSLVPASVMSVSNPSENSVVAM
jgi:hypothetical protein